MADVAGFDSKPFDIIDFGAYQDGGGSGKDFTPPAEGKYMGRLPLIKDDGSETPSENNHFGRTAEGYLRLDFGQTPIVVVDGPKPGYEIKYCSFSSKKYKGRMGSQTIDLLRACGIAAQPTSEAELRQALKMLSGRTFQFALVWEARNKDNREEDVKGMENFPVDPSDPSGVKRLPYVKDKYDDTKRWWANARIRYTVSAIKS